MAANLLDPDGLDNDVHVTSQLSNRTGTVGELRDFNALFLENTDTSADPPLPPGPVSYIDHGIVHDATLDQPDGRELTLTEDVQIAGLDLLSGDDLIAFLDYQILIRRRDLTNMRRLNYIHQTAVQNAVDIVQSKRLDFLEKGADTYTAGVFGALFLGVALLIFPEEPLVEAAIAGVEKFRIRTIGAKAALAPFVKKQTALADELANLEGQLDTLRRFTSDKISRLQKRLSTERQGQVLAAQKAGGVAAPALTHEAIDKGLVGLKTQINQLQSQLRKAPEDKKKFLDGVIEIAVQKKRSQAPKETPDSLKKAMDQAKKEVSGQPDPSLSAAPIDIAIKEQIQDLYSSLMFSAEDVIEALTEVRAACLAETPDENTLKIIADLVVFEDPDASSASEGTDVFAADIQDLVLRMTDRYEQLIWIFLYAEGLPKEIFFDLTHIQDTITQPLGAGYDKKYDLLLKYLQSRFYPGLDLPTIAKLYKAIRTAIVNLKPSAEQQFGSIGAAPPDTSGDFVLQHNDVLDPPLQVKIHGEKFSDFSGVVDNIIAVTLQFR